MIHMEGPDFEAVDNRLLSLILVKEGMTDAVIFKNVAKTNSLRTFYTKKITDYQRKF